MVPVACGNELQMVLFSTHRCEIAPPLGGLHTTSMPCTSSCWGTPNPWAHCLGATALVTTAHLCSTWLAGWATNMQPKPAQHLAASCRLGHAILSARLSASTCHEARRTSSAHFLFYPPMPHPKKVQGTPVGPQPSQAQGTACTTLPPHAANTLGGHPRMSNGLWMGWRSTWPALILICHAAHLLGHHPQGRLFSAAGPPPPINCAFQVGWRST